MLLFEEEFGEGSKELDNTEITTTILYFSKEELVEFKKLCKNGMKIMYGSDAIQKGNLPDFLLTNLRKIYGNKENNS